MKFATFDIESYNWIKLKTIGFYDGKSYEIFYDVSNFIDFVISKKYRSTRMYAHFGGAFDFKFLIPELIERGLKIHFIDSGSRILQLKVYKGKNVWYFVDSFNLIPLPQKKIAESFGVKHQKKEIDFTKLKEEDYYKKDMMQRLENDVIGLYEIIDKFRNWGLHQGKLAITLASQSMSVFNKNFKNHKLTNCTEKDEDFFRKTYYGGYTDIFKFYGESLNYYDFNSLYPDVMRREMPLGCIMATNSFKRDMIGYYKVRVNLKGLLIGCIPFVFKNKLIFPIGEFETYCTSAELELLEDLGQEYKVIQGLVFSDKAPVFKKYIEELYKIKQKSNKDSVDYIISKLELNSLYGKFAQKREQETVIYTSDYSEVLNEGLTPYIEELNFYKKRTISRSRNILPYLSSYVTSLARVKLYRKIMECGFDNVYYCDTDSIITNKKLSVGEKLGELKLEHEIEKAIFLQPKCYALKLKNGKEIIKLKGIPTSNISFKDFENAYLKKDLKLINYEYKKICGYKESLRRFKSTKIKRISVHKYLRSEYNKRIKIDEINTQPIKI